MIARRQIAWILLAGLAAATLLPSLYLLHLLRRAESSLEDHRADIAALTEDLQARSASRPAFLEPAEAGDVWDLLRPALEEVGRLYPLESQGFYAETSDPNLDWRGVPGETPELIEQATPAMEQCRRAMHRSELAWTGPMDPELPAKAGRMSRALCTKAAYAHQAGRDAEAAEWLIVAMGVAQDAARLGQREAWNMLHVVDKWVCSEARLLLAGHDLSVQDLAVFGRRLDILHWARPPFGLELRISGAEKRQAVLEGGAYVTQSAPGSAVFQTALLDETVGWKDLFSKTILRARVVNGIRAAVEELAAVEWKRVPVPDDYKRILSRYPEAVRDLAFDDQAGAGKEQLNLRRHSMFRLAVRFARVQAETGRFPATAAEAGAPADLGHALNIKDGEIDALSEVNDWDVVWTIRRKVKE